MTSVRRTLAALALAAPLLAGCGGGDDTSPSADSGGTPSTSASTSGSGETATKATDLCPLITPAEIAAIVGYEVVFERDPSNGCSYDSLKADARTEPSIGITNVLQVEGNGGLEGSKSGAAAAAQGVAEDLPGIGDGAFIVTSGPTASFNICSAGAIVKGQFVQVSVTGGGEANRAKLAPVTQKVLELAVSRV